MAKASFSTPLGTVGFLVQKQHIDEYELECYTLQSNHNSRDFLQTKKSTYRRRVFNQVVTRYENVQSRLTYQNHCKLPPIIFNRQMQKNATYTVSQKKTPMRTIVHNFVKFLPIFTIF